jgi:hypothetical protein
MAKRRNTQLDLAFGTEARGEAPSAAPGGTEASAARAGPERPAAALGPCMEAVVDRDNLRKALRQVQRNKGAPGVDGDDRRRLGGPPEGPWARDQGPAPRRNLQAPAGAAGGDPEGLGRRQAARRAHGARPLHPAGGAAGAASGLGPELLGGELRVPARTLGPSGGEARAGAHRRGLRTS